MGKYGFFNAEEDCSQTIAIVFFEILHTIEIDK